MSIGSAEKIIKNKAYYKETNKKEPIYVISKLIYN